MRIIVIDPSIVNLRDLLEKPLPEDVRVLRIRPKAWGELPFVIQLLDVEHMTTVQFEEIEPLLIKLSEGDQQ